MQTYQSTPDFYNDYISHHGILGMHWGKRNGPPYPLGAGDHSVSEKKAGWRKSLNSDPESNKKTITKKINKTGQKASNSEKQEKQAKKGILVRRRTLRAAPSPWRFPPPHPAGAQSPSALPAHR